MSNDKIITVRTKAFSGEGVREHKVMVEADALRVWDAVAGHYTLVHSISPASERRIRKLAAEA